ncbi:MULTISPECIES: DICT sensory domain-containing protein [Pseudonocardia]|uniref:DICT domain-containing protein n=2 Tax=Pseudonocardia TaxID=1847 RepID=A0A1Y2MXA6_PSEAH|nr:MULTISPECIES: DICT sensory domain-containing protein [Pseudonocardia]OSY39844.1 hypothetical protein BG845_03079 [Pseudonocardia autotrophica]TDN74440.1 diguanylate cyclase/two-component system sensory protein [Pseudonocardia autotrophica]BBG05207.1 hypothetical protein Pdca_64160 [Pseudonocardia autotrophica]GEC25785.1 hypothetical protein PSA01_28140 [Pseudonocardia saturnea]
MLGNEGPLAHAVRTASERAYVDGLTAGGEEAWARASGARPEPASKRLLVHLSHSIERAVMSGPRADPTVVVALFQRLEFFDRERAVYARMAEAGVRVVVGFVDGDRHDVPDGVHAVVLDPTEPLADEWTVVAAGPEAGAFLVATDQHRRDPQESGEQAGRVFLGRWGYSQAQTGSELARLRFALGDRLDPDLRRTIDHLLARSMPSGGTPASSSGTTGEAWATTSLNHMIDRLLSARAGTRELRAQLADAQQAAAARAAAELDPSSGLPTAEVLGRWTGPADPEALPVGIALFDLPELAGDRVRGDARAAYFAAHQVAAALTQPLGPVDTAVRLSEREFALVVPGASDRHLAGMCDRIGDQLQLASQGYPGVGLQGRLAMIVTRVRPLPIDDLRAALGHLPEQPYGYRPVDAGETPAGERIVVAATGSPGADPVAPPPQAHAPAPQRAPADPADPAEATPARRPRPYLDAGSGGQGASRPAGENDPHDAAQEALRRLVSGDGGADNRYDVFADLSEPGWPPAGGGHGQRRP